MHVKARMTAFSGLLLALSVVCMALGSVIETNTLFLLAAASYFVGIIIREFGMKAGSGFLSGRYPARIFGHTEQVLCNFICRYGILHPGSGRQLAIFG